MVLKLKITKICVNKAFLLNLQKTVLLILIVLSLSSCSMFYTTERNYIYQVKLGDTLASIAANFQMDFRELARYNRITNANQIIVGQVLEIPLSAQVNVTRRSANPIEFAKPAKFFRKKGKSNHNLLAWPIRTNKARLSSDYGWRWAKFHEGLDIAAATGTPIYAAHSGRVMMSGYQISGYGKMLIIQKDNMLTVYAHNSVNYVDVGQNVSAGQHIGDVGATGKATGPHLHFEVRFRNSDRKFVSVDPGEYLP